MRVPRICLAAVLACMAPQALTQEQGAGAGADKSGTNPLDFQTEFRLFNDTQFLPGQDYLSTATLQYTHPFASNFAVRLRAPLVASDVSGSSEFGLGDLNVRANWVPYISRRIGVLLGSEFSFDTASGDVPGSGKHTVAPVVVMAFFLKDGWLFAPAYQHTLSYAGRDSRPDIEVGAADFYVVKLTRDKRNWFIFDPTLIRDFENDRTYGSFEFEAGQIIGRKLGGIASLYFRPGVGIGDDRAYDWNLEVGFKVIGF